MKSNYAACKTSAGMCMKIRMHFDCVVSIMSVCRVLANTQIKAEFILKRKRFFFIALSHAHFRFLRSWASDR